MASDRTLTPSAQLERRLEERLRIALDAMPVAVSWARLEDMRIEFTNRKFTELFGYTIEDVPSIPRWLERAYADDADRKRAARAWTRTGRTDAQGRREIEPFEVEVRCKDGSLRSILHGGVVLPEAGWALATFVDITDRKGLEAALRRQSREDALTGLANRRAFDETLARHLARAEREESRLALLLVDLDGFKLVNDTHGHDAGDALLAEVGRRLATCVRPSDVVARIGGDEFAVALPRLESPGTAERIAERIRLALREGVPHRGGTLRVGTSLGLASFPDDARDAGELVRAADRALYRAKAAGRGRWSR